MAVTNLRSEDFLLEVPHPRPMLATSLSALSDCLINDASWRPDKSRPQKTAAARSFGSGSLRSATVFEVKR
jgi:hypothetical protein